MGTSYKTVAISAKRVPFSNKIGKRWDYSGGPVPESHGVPY
jgi:hypothetical protein